MARLPYPARDAMPAEIAKLLNGLPRNNITEMLAHAHPQTEPLLRMAQASSPNGAGCDIARLNELDPLRDEGPAYQRRLVANGVSAVGRTVSGTVHGSDMYFRAAMPDVYAANVRDIHGFASQPRQRS